MFAIRLEHPHMHTHTRMSAECQSETQLLNSRTVSQEEGGERERGIHPKLDEKTEYLIPAIQRDFAGIILKLISAGKHNNIRIY